MTDDWMMESAIDADCRLNYYISASRNQCAIDVHLKTI